MCPIWARRIKETVNVYTELKYYATKNAVICNVYIEKKDIDAEKKIGLISTSKVEEPNDVTKSMDRIFTNFKKQSSHMITLSHKKTLEDLKVSGRINMNKPDLRSNDEAALRCSRLCLEIYKKGNRFRHYPELVALQVKSGL